MVKVLKENFFVIPAAVLAALIYSGLFPLLNTKPYYGLLDLPRVSFVEGTVCGNPVKAGFSGGFYRVRLSLEKVSSADGFTSTAAGEADILLPESLYEIYQPGKLYSAWQGKKTDALLSKGARASFCVLFKGFSESGKNNFRPVFTSEKIISCSYSNSLFGRIQKARALMRLHWTRLMFAWGRAGGLLLALVSGSREYLEENAARSFRQAGLSHILALSGMHLSLFGGLALLFGKKTLGKRLSYFVEFSAILLFVWFAGRSPSLFRALLCSSAMILSRLFCFRIKSMLNLLSAVFIVHILLFPQDVFELSFILSYASLSGILCFNEFASKPLCKKIPYAQGSSLGQSTGAQFFTAPIGLRFFGLWTPGGILAGSVVSPLVTVFIYLGLLCSLVSFLIPPLSAACGSLLNGFYFLLSSLVNLFARIPCVRF